jgi:hypothetical protein
MFTSPPVGRSASAVAWTLFASAMIACCAGASYLVATALYAEWWVIKYGIAGLVSAAACGAVGTFTTTGTGRFAAQSSLAELLVCGQVVIGWGFVAVFVALLVPRAASAYKSRSSGRIVVRVDSPR